MDLDDVIAIRKKLGLLSPTIVDCTTDEELALAVRALAGQRLQHRRRQQEGQHVRLRLLPGHAEAAARNFRKFLYETNVAAGLPFIDTLQGLIRSGDELQTFEGILSGSLSMIFGLLEDGDPLSQAVAKAMELGFTEPDPRDDLSGMDVARKLLIIAREVGLQLELDDIDVEPVVPMDVVGHVDRSELIATLQTLDESFAERDRSSSRRTRCCVTWRGWKTGHAGFPSKTFPGASRWAPSGTVKTRWSSTPITTSRSRWCCAATAPGRR